MGNSCCNDANKDQHDKNFEGKTVKKPQKLDPALNELMKEAEKHPDEIAKIQAGFRGYKARKEYKNMKKGGD